MAKLDRLIRDLGTELQGYRLGPRRCREIAGEIGLLNRVVAKAARDLTFADEPSSFAVAVERGKRRGRRRAR